MAKDDVRALLEKEQQLAEIVSIALNGNPLEILLGLRSATYHETHPEEKTPLLKSIQTVAAAAKFLRFIEDPMLDALLQDHGISITIQPERAYQDAELTAHDRAYLEREYGTAALPYDEIKTLKELAYVLYNEGVEYRLGICEKMAIRKDAKRTVMKDLEIEAQEFNRLLQLTSLAVQDTDKTAVAAVTARARINTSLSNFNLGLSALSKHSGLKNHV